MFRQCNWVPEMNRRCRIKTPLLHWPQYSVAEMSQYSPPPWESCQDQTGKKIKSSWSRSPEQWFEGGFTFKLHFNAVTFCSSGPDWVYSGKRLPSELDIAQSQGRRFLLFRQPLLQPWGVIAADSASALWSSDAQRNKQACFLKNNLGLDQRSTVKLASRIFIFMSLLVCSSVNIYPEVLCCIW